MKSLSNRRKFLGILGPTLASCLLPAMAEEDDRGEHKRGGKGGGRRKDGEEYLLPPELAAFGLLSLVLGRTSGRSATVSALAKEAMEGYFEYGTAAGNYDHKTSLLALPAGKPVESVFDNLQPDTAYFYRLQCRKPGEAAFKARPECRLQTQRAAGSAFTFGVQGDSHPERPQMNDPELYARTLLNAAAGKPDFYICLGDDFSVDTLRTVTADTVAQRYALQRPFLGLVAQSAALVLVNGNHEQASLFNFKQTDVRHDVAVWAQNARNRYFPTPAPDGCFSGDSEPLEPIGPLKDYYAWTWGDALFVVLDNYWHSPVLVDSAFEGGNDGKQGHDGHPDRDWWALTLGDAQYRWFKRTLEQSKAQYKFVFAHHVLGSGRGGIEESELYEWGGRNKRGAEEFARKRPGWELPVHQLMAKHGVTIFFQGHDHLFARQERDGIVYQEVPNPADQGYVAYNQERYQSGVKLPNSGHLRVSVSPEQVQVDYVRCYLPKDETDKRKTGEVAYSYTIKPKGGHA
ncbi:MAG: metallophosphoesterase [Planctomycetota bacterium]